MGRKPTKKAEIVKQALAQFPKMSKRGIASYLFETYPAMFSSVEAARMMIKAYTTPSGVISNENKVSHETDFSASNPFGIPDSTETIRVFIDIDKSVKNVLVISDIHFPNHDKGALNAALSYGKKQNIDCIVLNGDIFDNEPFTSHLAPPPILSDVRRWFEMVEEFIDNLIKSFSVPIYWLEGNHDAWYKRYLMKSAPLLFHDSYYTLSSRLKLREKGVTWIPEHHILMVGKLPITHGHLVIKGFFSPVNPAKGVYNKLKSSMLIGHCHTTSEHSESVLTHELTTCYSIGCLCTLAPGYDPFNTKHNQGFAIVELDEKGNYRVHNKRINYLTKEIY